MGHRTPTSDRRAAERGFTLAGLIVILTVMMIFVAYTVPQQWSMVMKRERDRQTIFAMKQYTIAIATFQKKHNVLPTSLKQLKEAQNPRVVRGVSGFINDPASGEPDWLLLPVGTPPGNGGGVVGGPPAPGSGGVMIGAPSLQARPPTPGVRGPAVPAPPQEGPPGSQQLAGGFVGVRPNRKGEAFLELNGSNKYEEWTYTVDDLTAEATARSQALLKK